MSGRILVGTCSWADRSLIDCGCFYPPEAKTPEDRLRFYASRFPIVEIDSTYYSLPSERNAALWAERTPDDFTFDVKAFRLFTQHPTPPQALPKDVRETLPPMGEKRNLYDRDLPDDVRDELWRRYADALLPLDSAGKLGVVVFQFPPWFLPGREARDYIVRVRERLPQYRVAVEFRNGRWFAETNRARTLDFLRANDIPLVAVDSPQGLPSSVPPVEDVTSDIALVRFHGRNREMWAKVGASVGERFDYLYSEEELREWVPRIRRMAEQVREVHLLMNNCVRDKAVVNAAQLNLMLNPSS